MLSDNVLQGVPRPIRGSARYPAIIRFASFPGSVSIG